MMCGAPRVGGIMGPVTSRLVEILRSATPEREIADELGPLLADCVARATRAWPNVTVAEDQFVRAIAERLAGDAPARSLGAMQTDDLYLACGCAAGDPGALAGFEQRCSAAIARAIATTGASRSERADLGQVVRQRLLVAPADGGAPRIASYSARGPLPAWARVVATREAARMLSRVRREVAAGDDDLASLIAGDDDPEIGYLKRLYRAEFKRAFHAAVEALDDRARLMLRQHALDGLGIDRLAALHGVHRATAARWIDAAREAVLAGTHRELVRRLQLSRSELASMIRLIHSQLDVSLARLLRR
jgi:RNA polymerase sigma-70 factor (ECF subfamily)